MDEATRADTAGDETIATLLSRVVADAEHVARAEIELQKAKVVAKIDEARKAILLLLAAISTGAVALTALVVGALMILTPLIGPGGATAIVVGTLVLLAVLLGWLAMQQFKLLFGSTDDLA